MTLPVGFRQADQESGPLVGVAGHLNLAAEDVNQQLDTVQTETSISALGRDSAAEDFFADLLRELSGVVDSKNSLVSDLLASHPDGPSWWCRLKGILDQVTKNPRQQCRVALQQKIIDRL